MLKRLFDLVLAIILLLFFSPLFIIVIIILSITGEGEIFYKQERVGFKNKKFNIIKFATMYKNSELIGDKDITQRGDSRITPFGRMLRQTKINEIPQLINVINGTMSFVGPRPLMLSGFNRYSDDIKKVIYNIKPGITSLGSIFFRDEELVVTKSKLEASKCHGEIILPFKGKLEVWYQLNMSFYSDLKILLLTLMILLFNNIEYLYKFFPNAPRPTSELWK